MTAVPATGRNPIARLRDATWMEVIKTCYLILIGGMLFGLIAGSELRSEIVMPASLALVLMLLAAKDLSGAPEAMQRWRIARREGQGAAAQLYAFLPPGVVGWGRLERTMWSGCWAWLRRRPNTQARPDGTPLHYLHQGAYSTAVGIALVSLLVELPLHAMILPLFGLDPASHMKLHVLLAAGCVYSLVWVTGDRWHVRNGCHVLADDVLDLRIGTRARARIPLAAVVHCERIDTTREQWCRKHGVHARDAIVISPFDRPNVMLRLAPDSGVSVSLFGHERPAPSHIFLYVDRPQLLVQRVASPGVSQN